jgi:hypothetical protein
MEATNGAGGPASVLVGWEAPLLRAYRGTNGTEIFLGSRSLGRW